MTPMSPPYARPAVESRRLIVAELMADSSIPSPTWKPAALAPEDPPGPYETPRIETREAIVAQLLTDSVSFSPTWNSREDGAGG